MIRLPTSQRSAWLEALLFCGLALAWRLILTPAYYGWEESDYGNLAMARGVLDSGFLEYDMRHLPFYYFLSALVLALSGDAIFATHAVSMLSGSLAVGLAYAIARKAFDVPTARLTALVLCFQPEFALYAASSLREPLYACLVLLGCALLLHSRGSLAALATGFAFLSRFDAVATAMPALLWHQLRRPGRLRSLAHPLWASLVIFALFVTAWSVYCGQMYGRYLFFMSTVEVNVDTGGARELVTRLDFIRQGLEVVAGLFFRTLPAHLGPLLWGLLLPGLWLLRGQLFSRGSVGTLFAYLGLHVGFWLGVGFVAQHEPGHNLYWKWLYTLVPFWTSFAMAGAVRLGRRLELRPWVLRGLAALMLIGVGYPFVGQTHAQLELSRTLYKPQVDLAEWVEARVPAGTTLIFDNIPERYVNRRPNELHCISWFDLNLPENDRLAFAAFLQVEKVRYVLWFKEDWTQAPRIAPWLGEREVHRLPGLTLVPLFHEEQYGFIFYQVNDDPAGAAPSPTVVP